MFRPCESDQPHSNLRNILIFISITSLKFGFLNCCYGLIMDIYGAKVLVQYWYIYINSFTQYNDFFTATYSDEFMDVDVSW